MKAVGIGEIVWDCLPDGKRLGGAPVNFTYFAGQCGADAFAVSAVGKDALGGETLRKAEKFGLDVSYIQQNGLPTSRVLVSLDTNGIPSYEIVKPVAWDALEPTEEALKLMSDADMVCWGSLAQRSEKSRAAVTAMVAAAPRTCLKVFDVNLRQDWYSKEVLQESLCLADVLKLNEDELPVIENLFGLKGIPEIISRFRLEYLIYTCGAAFSEVYSPEGLLSHIDTPKVEVADTVGAGDSFTAVWVTSLKSGYSPEEAHGRAVRIAAQVCECHGAICRIPGI